jgi:indole-3-glycerol phosphate synthase
VQAERYERGGAVAVSVLTEARHFGGSLADLRLARGRTILPILRKDFIVHPVQVLEARAEGADAVLLIAAALSESELRELAVVAHEVGLATLVEAHSEADLAKALAAGAGILGVNSRDLETLQVDVERALALLASAPPDRVRVLESGVSSRHQVLAAADAGADAVLVGEAVMRAPDPVAKIAELLGR